MKYIEAPTELTGEVLNYGTTDSLFLAGGITGCPNWQGEMVGMLQDEDLIILNPRRENFPIHDPQAAHEQITWEHKALRLTNRISFWFAKETLCPIVLYELGAWSMTGRKIYVGMDPEYQRRQDVEIQTELARPDVEVVYSLEALAEQTGR